MTESPNVQNLNYNPNNIIENPMNIYLDRYNEADPEEMSMRTGVPYEDGAFHFHVLNEDVLLAWPNAEPNGSLGPKDVILFMHFLLEGNKTEGSTHFVSYADMPWGDVYDVPFRGRCIRRLIGVFGTNKAGFEKACQALGGTKVKSSGCAYQITFMEGYDLQFILWEGDDEFPASGQIIFSDNFPDGFPAEDRVVVVEYVLKRLTLAMS